VNRFRFIAAEKARHAVVRLCRVLGVSPSGFYAWAKRRPAPRTRANEALAKEIRGIHARSRGTYGAPRIHAELQATGRRASRKRVARLMRIAGLVGRGRRPARRTTIPDPAAQAQDLVKRDFRPTAPDRLWLADITYVRTDEGWLYLAAVIDLCSRRVVGWSMADHMEADLVADALRMALARRRPDAGLLHHSDRGSQYASDDYQHLLASHGITRSMSGKGDCWDNAVMESFWATLEAELVHPEHYATREQARRSIFEYIEVFYNRQRLHSSLGYVSPETFEATLN
jgi:putative transposase